MERKYSRRIFAFILSFLMIIGTTAGLTPKVVKAAGKTVFTLTSDATELKRGDEFTVEVHISDCSDAYGFSYELIYDPEKVAVIGEPLKGNVFDDADIGSLAIYEKGHLVNATVGNLWQPVSEGTVMSVTFKVLDNSSAGHIDFDYDIDLSDGNAEALEYTNDDRTNVSVVIPVTGISLNKESATIARGDSEKLTATVEPEGTGTTVVWSSDDEDVATVSQDGTVQAKAKGTATITAEASGRSASCKVTVNAPLQGIQITGEQSTIKKGTTTQLSVIYDPEDTTDEKTVVWSSSEESVATVDQNGLVTAVADGTTVITAKAGELEATYEITVQEVKLVSISINESATIHRGESEKLEITYNPENTTDDKTAEWFTSDPTVATVDGSGTVTAVGIGDAEITAKVGNHVAICTVTVDAPLKQIVPSSGRVELVKGQKEILGYTLDPADTTDSKTVTFSSSASEIASVNETTGEVTAVKAGSAKITLTGANQITAVVDVVVTEIPINSVVLNLDDIIVEKDYYTELTANIYPENTTDDDRTIKWTSSDSSVVSVSASETQTGVPVKVTANKGGTAVITATAWNGTKAECVITVPIHIDQITLDQNITLNRGKTAVIGMNCDPEVNDDTIKSVIWNSANEDVAAVSENGTVYAKKAGTAVVTAKVTVETLTGETKELSADTTVTVKENHLDQDLGNTISFKEIKDPVLKGQSIAMYGLLNLSDILSENEITDDVTIEWSSADETIAAIDQTGTLTGVKEGKTTVTAVITAADGEGRITGTYTVSAEVAVKEIPMASIAFDKLIREMPVGATEILHILYNPDNTTDARDVTWMSSDASVLSVENGKLTALKPGKAVITAKAGTCEVSCEITVKATDTSGSGQGSGDGNQSGTADGSDNGSGAVRTGNTENVLLYIFLAAASIMAVIAVLRRKYAK